MAKGMRVNNFDRPTNVNKKRTKLRLTDKINQTICSRGSINTIGAGAAKSAGRSIVMRDVKGVFSHTNGRLEGTVQLSKERKVRVTFDVKLSAWVYEE